MTAADAISTIQQLAPKKFLARCLHCGAAWSYKNLLGSMKSCLYCGTTFNHAYMMPHSNVVEFSEEDRTGWI